MLISVDRQVEWPNREIDTAMRRGEPIIITDGKMHVAVYSVDGGGTYVALPGDGIKRIDNIAQGLNYAQWWLSWREVRERLAQLRPLPFSRR